MRTEIQKVKNVTPRGQKATRFYTQEIDTFGTLGRELKISPKANVVVNKPGFKTEFFVETVNINIGIGNDYTADIIMTKDAWEAFKDGAKISITTNKEFKKRFL